MSQTSQNPTAKGKSPLRYIVAAVIAVVIAGTGYFAFGSQQHVPDADPATQRAALDFLQRGLAHNLNAAPATHPVQIEVAAGGALLGTEINLSGASPKVGDAHSESRLMHARFVAKGAHAYQIAIVSSAPLPDDQTDQFFSSFKLY